MPATFDVKKFREALVSGQRMLGSDLKNSPFILSASSGYLSCSFHGTLVKYGVKIKSDGEFPLISLDPVTLIKVIGSKNGDVTLDVAPGGAEVKLTSKKFSAKLPTVPVDTSIKPLPVGKKPNIKASMDASALTSIPKTALSMFRSIRDNISGEELSATAVWSGKKLTVLLADGFHGTVLDIDLPEKAKKAKITLPTQVFLKVVEIGGYVNVDESTVTALSKTEYLKATIQNTSNQHITLKMMEGVLQHDVVSSCHAYNGEMLSAISACQSVAVETSYIKLSRSKSTLTVSISSPSGDLSEKMKISNPEGKSSASASITVNNLKDIVSCMGSVFSVGWTAEDTMLFESGGENVLVRGVCRAVS